jgi:hypothetical protein
LEGRFGEHECRLEVNLLRRHIDGATRSGLAESFTRLVHPHRANRCGGAFERVREALHDRYVAGRFG